MSRVKCLSECFRAVFRARPSRSWSARNRPQQSFTQAFTQRIHVLGPCNRCCNSKAPCFTHRVAQAFHATGVRKTVSETVLSGIGTQTGTHLRYAFWRAQGRNFALVVAAMPSPLRTSNHQWWPTSPGELPGEGPPPKFSGGCNKFAAPCSGRGIQRKIRSIQDPDQALGFLLWVCHDRKRSFE